MKYKIFISANQKELRDERFAIKDVVNDNATLRQCFDVFFVHGKIGEKRREQNIKK